MILSWEGYTRPAMRPGQYLVTWWGPVYGTCECVRSSFASAWYKALKGDTRKVWRIDAIAPNEATLTLLGESSKEGTRV